MKRALTFTAIAAIAASSMMVPTFAAAQGRSYGSGDVCREQQRQSANKGTVIGGLSAELVQKLQHHKPETLGQASRIQGMTPAAISILLVHLKRGGVDVARWTA